MDLLSKDIKKFSIQADILSAFNICAIRACGVIGTPTANTALGKMFARILNSPEDAAWWKQLSYYTISNNQTGLDWATYASLSDADRATFEDTLVTLLETVIVDLSISLFAPDGFPNSAILTIDFACDPDVATAEAAYDAWRTTNPTYTVIRKLLLEGDDAHFSISIDYVTNA